MHSGVNAAQRLFQPHQLSSSLSNYYDKQSNSSTINATMSRTPSNAAAAGRRKRERPSPNGSNLLTDAENEQLFQVFLKFIQINFQIIYFNVYTEYFLISYA